MINDGDAQVLVEDVTFSICIIKTWGSFWREIGIIIAPLDSTFNLSLAFPICYPCKLKSFAQFPRRDSSSMQVNQHYHEALNFYEGKFFMKTFKQPTQILYFMCNKFLMLQTCS